MSLSLQIDHILIRIFIIVIALWFQIAEGLAQSPAISSVVSSEVSIFGDASAIIVPVSRHGRNFRFLLDTGSTYTILDSKTFDDLLEPFGATNANSREKVRPFNKFANSGDLLVTDKFPIRAAGLYRLDLSRLSSAIGETIHGVLGCDFLGQFAVEVDADAARMRLISQDQPHLGKPVQLSRDKSKRPTYDVSSRELDVESLNATFLIDTGLVGLTGVTLHKDLFDVYLMSGHLTIKGHQVVAQGDKNRTERFGTLRRLRIWTEVDEIYVGEKAGEQKNLLGLSYLMQFNFTLDLPNSKLYLRPRKAPFRLLQLKDASGFSIWRPDSEIYVYRIEPQGPAADAGLREGDVITSVDGVPAEKLRLHPLRVSFCEEGKIVRLGVRRNSRSLAVDLHLADWRKPATKADFE